MKNKKNNVSKKFLCSFLVFLAMASGTVHAQQQGPQQDSRWFRITLAAFATSKAITRGAVFYPYATGFAGPAFTFFNQLNVRGPNISWNHGTRQDKSSWELGVRLINDGAPFVEFNSKFDEDTDYRASRRDSFETYFRYNYRFGFRNLFGVGIEAAKDLNTHEGHYVNLSFRLPLYKFLSMTLSSGFGSAEHNRFIYGEGSKSGLGHQDINVTYVIPGMPWGGMTFFSLTQSYVIQSSNRTASLIRNNYDQLVGTVRVLYFF